MIADEPVSWDPVRAYVAGRVSGVPPIAGTEAWIELGDDDPLKLAGVLVGGSRWALETELRQRDQRAWALKCAARDLGRELDWARVARRIRERDAWHRDHPDLKRKVA